ncbi:hypothetical protein [Amycolatopsis lexingtonensis]|uniref:hypothetical protein n=1 Tax=Amycolatopsis lexingtonensis TaxID=218822 RepID=UPI003F6E8507
MTITAQWVRVSWTKHSRGGPAAAVRNAVPAGFALPALPAGAAHVVRLREADGFTPVPSVERLRDLAVDLGEADGRLRVKPRVDGLFGIPPRERRPPAVKLARGEWLRWRLNYRFSSAAGMRDWSYWLDTFNIGYGELPADAFLGEPAHSVDERGPVR